MPDPFQLGRFGDAQAPVYDRALGELKAGAKRTHWMWFVFPQIAGLGHSAMAQHYALASLEEAKSYLAHPVLGPRLLDCTAAVNAVPGRTANQIFGSPDDAKFRSSMTLFAAADPSKPAFKAALDNYYGGQRDPATLHLLGPV